MQEKLIAWIEGNQNYEQGVLLYRQYGKSEMLKKVLATGPTSYNRAKLLAEIQAIYATIPQQEILPAANILDQEIPDHEIQEKLSQERKSCLQQAAYLKAQLPLIQDPAKRKSIAFKILDLHDRNNEIWAMQAYKEAHGIYPNQAIAQEQKPELESLPLAELQRQLLVLRPKISRLASKPDQAEKRQALMQEKFRLEQLIAKAHAI